MQCILCNSTTMCFQISLRFLSKRMIHSNVQPLTKVSKEVEIKVPWGKVTGRLWGSENKQPALALHGWQDNAGSFDALAPLLLKNTPILAIDFPGHGLSSWLPPGIIYNDIIYMILLRRLKNYFGWDKMKIIGHSMGAFLNFCYSSLFPNEIKYMVSIDALTILSLNEPEYYQSIRKKIIKFLELEEFANELNYTEEEIIIRWISATDNSLDEASCRMLMTRGVKQVEYGKYAFNRDPRVKLLPTFSHFTKEHLCGCVKFIKCPCLIISAENSCLSKKRDLSQFVNIIKENNVNVYWEEVIGTHHVHMRDAKTVANIVNSFLEKYDK